MGGRECGDGPEHNAVIIGPRVLSCPTKSEREVLDFLGGGGKTKEISMNNICLCFQLNHFFKSVAFDSLAFLVENLGLSCFVTQ